MKVHVALFALLLLAGAPALATTLESIASPLAVLAGQIESPRATWSALAKAPGIRWRDADVRTRGQGYARSGSVTLDRLGKADITWEGTTNGALTADVRTGVRLKPADYGAAIKSQFPTDVRWRKVRDGCRDDVYRQSAVYEVTLQGRAPLYLLVNTQASWNGGNTTVQISPDLESRWACG
jgi:hypothetical protein